MQIRMLEGRPLCGADVSHAGGGVYDLPDEQGFAVLDEGHAEAVGPVPDRGKNKKRAARAAAEESARLKAEAEEAARLDAEAEEKGADGESGTGEPAGD